MPYWDLPQLVLELSVLLDCPSSFSCYFHDKSAECNNIFILKIHREPAWLLLPPIPYRSSCLANHPLVLFTTVLLQLQS
ncbi:hypothetical protein JHK82_020788 [Glycine max]|uniref:Uncharacterized protein n=1 Tax=Glycine max TaxID=3847 RepID=A0A0R0IIX5_SOYBN|nr:hypothetical protein JHK85_021236 [Glycine max]KAG5024887.1 hypothetical protein JHK86_020801 [Glycine max]KAG5136057.1 hypothetical protein JHK82_020788 [Glycine max]KAH1050216.1 hypothetical protein GYH30_020616 [Glycine max]KRH42316.1 hypothetical protein GLYMA_08G082800v4 [Glycine max]